VIKGLKLLLIVSIEIKIEYGNKMLQLTALYFYHFSHCKVSNSGSPMQYAQSPLQIKYCLLKLTLCVCVKFTISLKKLSFTVMGKPRCVR